MKLILFDIDGTLLWTDGAGRRAIHQALFEETGITGLTDRYRFDGKTDPQIVRELMRLAAHPRAEDDACVTAVCTRYVGLLERELSVAPRAPRVMPGVHELLAALEFEERAGRALVGLLTGNLATGADLKLRAAGFEPARFAVGAYGSDSGVRAELPPVAARRAAERAGRAFAGADIVLVGDTPDDVACGRPIGARTVAVATGHFDVAALHAAGAHAVLRDLADTDAALAAILTPPRG